MQNHEQSLPRDGAEIERETPPGVLDLMALYELIEDVYIKATILSSTVPTQMTTGNSTNVPLQRGA